MRYLASRFAFILVGFFSLAAYAVTYPMTVTDMAGRHVTIKSEPKRIVLQDGRDVLMLAVLDKKNPFKRVVAWNNILKKDDSGFWTRLTTQWPSANKILDMNFGDGGQLNLEEVLTHRPDLLVAELRSKPTLEQGGVIKTLAKLNIPVLFVDTAENPIKDAPASVKLLGKVLNKEKNGDAYFNFYQKQLKIVDDGVKAAVAKQGGKRPNVFIEAHAGVKGPDDCCFTHNNFGWADLVEAAGGNNLGSDVLTAPSGVVAMEKVLEMKPDVYVMTGSQWKGRSKSIALPLGYDVTQKEVQNSFKHLLARPGFKQMKAYHDHRIYGAYHQFYNHPYNIVGVEGLAKDFYPKEFKNLHPTQTYQTILARFTDIKSDKNLTLFAHAKE
ncbi:Vitamin B12-binding protein [Marinomonas spartinae]|uniref:ABC transporter substrate-binding protein n=1 Tax=Marinomonas spartinae TaxID=1792290 RepID=UPI000808B39A|nr:ABC transporter substrate-binding protein [Marinomonas spartinae]SBS38736.1 Vitamin B12-binding protein [Marinomonas spartinae]